MTMGCVCTGNLAGIVVLTSRWGSTSSSMHPRRDLDGDVTHEPRESGRSSARMH